MNKYLKLAIIASIEAGEKIMEIYQQDFQVFEKEDLSPLTEADKLSNEIICSHIQETGIPIISEENKQIGYEIRKDWNVCWLVDPIDGTKEFIKRNVEFTVNIALIENGMPVLGVIYVPVTRELFYADVNKGFSKKVVVDSQIELLDFDTSVELKKSDAKTDLIRIVGSRSHMNEETLTFLNQVKENSKKDVEIVSKGSSLKFCLIAEDKADIYPRFAPTMEWDTAAAHALCKALGISVQSYPNGEELVYNKKDLKNPWFLCKHKEIVI